MNDLTKPHIVMIMADQLRADLITPQFAPNIHKLSQESFRFNRAYCASPLCVPARGSFFTGRYPNQTGCLINPWEAKDATHGHVRRNIPNLYQLLENDWDSWHTGKQHLLTEDRFDRSESSHTSWLPLEGRYAKHLKEQGKRMPGGALFKGIVPEMASGTTTRPATYSIPTTGCYEEGFDAFFDGFILNDSLHALQHRDRTKPLFLSAMFLAPHPPLEIPEPWYSMYTQTDITLPENVGVWSKHQSPLQLYNLTGAIGVRYSREEWHRIWTVYTGLVRLLDDCVGRIIQELKTQGIYDDTLLIFTSDHGEMLGSHSLWQKMCMYEESVRTPLLLKFPERFKCEAQESNALVSAIDIVPTLCDYLGLPIPEGVAGTSLLPLVNGHHWNRDKLFIQFDGNGARGNFQRCVIEGDYKLIVDWFKDEIFIELYDLASDAQELINLAFQDVHRPRILSLLEYLREHMLATGDLLKIPDDAYAMFIDRYTPFAF
ncbi:sulfatase family protein [Paenibacillus aceris]|uniref:Arylsulfatase A-like enzyme n=1 Tax=Paenibacillus aceris TaxID=869555 RepID=A0ABS4HX31_9BACL|nr:sulfatase-like hydrolase/transferase [Paenibacillus aceris]MBP1963205.1 arylsulfatase A-like enzyme [Paenibacillus aceris]NHW38679.1 sulfatase-like hydrolase/transferase [Paenibacillus aceris]